ncbi:hypothetical protein [Erwinia mallotivora]|nr:hypothetical protein [Erwinia mallotivora]
MKRIHRYKTGSGQRMFSQQIMAVMSDLPENEPPEEIRYPLDDAQFAIVVLVVTSFTLIMFVLAITLLIT